MTTSSSSTAGARSGTTAASGPRSIDPPLGGGVLAAYAAPGVPLALLGLPLYVYLPAWYGEQLGLALVGALLLAARASDIVTDPLIGMLGDRVRSGFGARRSVMLLGAPLLLVSVEALFRPGADVGGTHLLAWSVAAYLGWTLVQMPYLAWGAELSSDHHERSRITAWREVAVILGTVLALSAPALAGIGGDAGAALDLLAGMMWVLLPICVLAALLVVPDAPRTRREPRWREGWAVLADNRLFRRLFVAYLLNGIANALPATLFLLYVGNVLRADAWAGPLLLAYFASGALALPVWLRLARRHGKHRVWAASMLLGCVVFACVPLLGEGDVAAFAVVCVLSGLALGVDMALPASMQADVVDLDQVRTGVRRAGLFFGLWGMATKLALALAVGLAFPLLEMAGFVPGDDGRGVWALIALYAFVPLLIKLTAVSLVWRFPLAERQHAVLRGRIAADSSA